MPLDPLDNLIEVLRLKVLCRGAGLAGVDSTSSRNYPSAPLGAGYNDVRWIRLKLGHEAAMGSAQQWITQHPRWELKVKENVIRVRQDELGNRLLPKLQEALRFLAG